MKIRLAVIRDDKGRDVAEVEATEGSDDLSISINATVTNPDLERLKQHTIYFQLDGSLEIDLTSDTPQPLTPLPREIRKRNMQLLYDPDGIDEAHGLRASIFRKLPHTETIKGLANPASAQN